MVEHHAVTLDDLGLREKYVEAKAPKRCHRCWAQAIPTGLVAREMVLVDKRYGVPTLGQHRRTRTPGWAGSDDYCVGFLKRHRRALASCGV
jgi:hypothetical protein